MTKPAAPAMGSGAGGGARGPPTSRGGLSGNGSRRVPASRHAADRARLRPVDHRRTRRHRRAGGLRAQLGRRWTGGRLCRLQDRGWHGGGAGPHRCHQPAAARSAAAVDHRRPHGLPGGRCAAGGGGPAAGCGHRGRGGQLGARGHLPSTAGGRAALAGTHARRARRVQCGHRHDGELRGPGRAAAGPAACSPWPPRPLPWPRRPAP